MNCVLCNNVIQPKKEKYFLYGIIIGQDGVPTNKYMCISCLENNEIKEDASIGENNVIQLTFIDSTDPVVMS